MKREWRNRRHAVTLLVLIAIASTRSSPQDETLHVEVDLIDLYVAVADQRGVPIIGLGKENFRISEDGVEQQVRHFSNDDVPFTLGMVLDRSGSMSMVIDDVYKAALHTLEASRPEDESFVIVFNDKIDLVQDFTSDRKALQHALRKVAAGGQTALYDAVYTAINHIRKGKYRKKALLVVTDGADNSSETSYRELLQVAKESEVQIHVIGFFGDAMRFGSAFQDSPAVDKLSQLATVTGGRAYFPKTMEACRQACVDTANELRSQYTLGYYSTNEKKDGTWRKVRVDVVGLPPDRGGVVVQTRDGYYAPVH